MQSRFFTLLFFLFFCAFLKAQKDTIPYRLFNKDIVTYIDYGFNTAPIKLIYPFESGISRIKLKNNISSLFGIGFAYKWVAFRIGFTLPGTLRPSSKYGKTNYFDTGIEFSRRRMHYDIDYHYYQGYSIKNAYRWNDSLNKLDPNEIRSDIISQSLSFNLWFFQSKNFKMAALKGRTGNYKSKVNTMYFKYSFNIYGIGSNRPIVPPALQDTMQSKTESSSIGALEFAVIPGYAFARRLGKFQVGGFIGGGLSTQTKWYTFGEETRSFLGLAFRYDIKFIAGLNEPRYFLMFVTDFDNKSVRFNELAYRQTFYSLKLVGGVRFPYKKETKKKSNKKK